MTIHFLWKWIFLPISQTPPKLWLFHSLLSSILLRSHATYLLVCLWCCRTMFFSWIVSSNAVASDLRSEMDCGVAGRLQPWSSDNSSWTITLKTQIRFGYSYTEMWYKHLLSIKELFSLLKWIFFFLELTNKDKRPEIQPLAGIMTVAF